MAINDYLITNATSWVQNNMDVGQTVPSEVLGQAMGMTDEENDVRPLILELASRGVVEHFDEAPGAGSFRRVM